MNDLVIYQKAYDFTLYLFPIVEKFPKHEKFVLCTHIKSCVLDIARLIIRANKSRTKKAILYDIDVKIEELKFLLRLSHDRKYLSNKSYEHSSKLLLEIGRLLGGWIKSVG
ncbi:MAG: diversity-generating retroelement protein Avd [Nitrospirae bacterium]|nr:diversity-generating retroelement protein Avd [Nitrospirota bacterium]MCL5237397.1 diversity-generating retroelement protein Avd [Nitrospirota bacterium]